MKILVTGGAGFIGSAVVRLAVGRGHEVVNLDALTYAASLTNVASVSASSNYSFEQVDIRNRAELDRVFKEHQPDRVMHLAAESHVDRSIDGRETSSRPISPEPTTCWKPRGPIGWRRTSPRVFAFTISQRMRSMGRWETPASSPKIRPMTPAALIGLQGGQ